MYFYRIVFLIVASMAVVDKFVLANDQHAILQIGPSICVSPLLQDRTSKNHLHERKLFAAIVDVDDGAAQAALQAGTDSSVISNAIFAIYKTNKTTLDTSNLNVQTINPEAILIPKPDDTPLDKLFKVHDTIS